MITWGATVNKTVNGALVKLLVYQAGAAAWGYQIPAVIKAFGVKEVALKVSGKQLKPLLKPKGTLGTLKLRRDLRESQRSVVFKSLGSGPLCHMQLRRCVK